MIILCQTGFHKHYTSSGREFPMRQLVSRSRWAVEICGVFLHPIQPLAHEGLAQHILFDIHKMSGPIEHSERRSGVVVQQIPGVPVSTEVVLSCGQHERGATKGCE